MTFLRYKARRISTHALREEGDGVQVLPISDDELFLPTPSARRATRTRFSCRVGCCGFLPTPSARRATESRIKAGATAQISTHALREEGDKALTSSFWVAPHFYPRPPRGGRPDIWWVGDYSDKFLPTPSARRATGKPSRGEQGPQGISTHALREEGDSKCAGK